MISSKVCSKICPIDGSIEATAEALKEADAFARYGGLTGKQALHLRLLTEELLGVLNGVAQIQKGSFAIEREDNKYQIKLSAKTMPLGEKATQRLLNASSRQENVLYKGVTGKLRMLLDAYNSGLEAMVDTSGLVGEGFVEYPVSSDWSLFRLKESIKREQRAEEWDELERSVLSKIADDVQVGMRYGTVVITVFKTF